MTNLPDKSNEIIVTGWVKSGNTWIARLLADALNSPLVGKFDAIPIGQEGLNRNGDYRVIQLHLVPNCENNNGKFIVSRFHICPANHNSEKLIIVLRDPRDIVVSCWKYWELPTIRETIRRMYEVEWPLSGSDAWHIFIKEWSICDLPRIYVKYEDMREDTLTKLTRLLIELDINPTNDLNEVIERQSLLTKKQFFNGYVGHYHPYGIGIQLKNLRKGIVGDWKNHFIGADAEYFHNLFFETMRDLGYEDNEYWYREVS